MRKKDAYLVAVSGGADSMALLDMLNKNSINIHVAHVNYNKRDTAIRDELIVKKYCDTHNIKLHIKKVEDYPSSGNFQDYARKVRYDFFKSLCCEFDLQGVIVAHHLDDCLETYILKKYRKQVSLQMKMEDFNIVDGLNIYRPLLNQTKKDLKEYCLQNDIEYGEDESNFSNDYKRNQIRHEYIDKMTISDKNMLMDKIDKEQKVVNKVIEKTNELIVDNLFYSHQLPHDVDNYLAMLVFLNTQGIYSFSKKQWQAFNDLCKTKKHFIFDVLQKRLIYDQGIISVNDINFEYTYTYKEVNDMDETTFFKLSDNGNKFEKVTCSIDDWPIVIRNYRQGDKIRKSYGHKRVSRYFIDNKIPLVERLYWPVIENKDGEIIYVYKLGNSHRDIQYNNRFFIDNKKTLPKIKK